VPGPQVEGLVERIRQALPRHGNLESAVAAVRAELDLLSPGLAANLSGEIDEAASIVAREFEQIEILHSHSVIRKRPEWYFGPRPSDLHWPAVKSFLLNEKKWHEDDVRGIDDASNEVVSLLENPRDPARSQFSCRGLVVGHVQSGKTANMTAVIAKALDAGYDTVIVLAGLTNKLRHQTQLRLYSDLVRRNPLNWQVLTSNEVDRDFRAPPQGGFLSHSDKAQLAVIKKNVSPLGELRKAIRETLPAVLQQLRVLVIDDECDQASVNSARGRARHDGHQPTHPRTSRTSPGCYLCRLHCHSLRECADQPLPCRRPGARRSLSTGLHHGTAETRSVLRHRASVREDAGRPGGRGARRGRARHDPRRAG
jgi:hypothetical protein